MRDVQGIVVDENLSPKVAAALTGRCEKVVHVRDLGLKSGSDTDIWQVAKLGGLVILTKGSDFHQRSFVWGHPPKVIWLRIGNSSTRQVINLLRENQQAVLDFCADPSSAFLVLRP